jgi:hypothetical protein
VSERSAALEPVTLDLDGSIVAPILVRHRAMVPFETASSGKRSYVESAL